MAVRRRRSLAALGTLAVLTAGSPAAAPAADAVPSQLRFEKLNRTYTDFVPPLDSVYEGGVSVQLASPKQSLILRDHRVHLTPQADGSFAGDVELDIQGKGTVIADVAFGPLAERFNDEVIVPPQTLKLEGRVRMRRVAGGYAIDPVQMPRKISVAIQSRTVNSILALCDQAAIVSLGTIQCDGLDRALTHPAMSFPEGASFTLQDGDLTDADRAALNALLTPSPAT